LEETLKSRNGDQQIEIFKNFENAETDEKYEESDLIFEETDP